LVNWLLVFGKLVTGKLAGDASLIRKSYLVIH
jgi:hypothetical protein